MKLWWLFAACVVQIGSAVPEQADKHTIEIAVAELAAAYHLIQKLASAQEKSEYKVEKLVGKPPKTERAFYSKSMRLLSTTSICFLIRITNADAVDSFGTTQVPLKDSIERAHHCIDQQHSAGSLQLPAPGLLRLPAAPASRTQETRGACRGRLFIDNLVINARTNRGLDADGAV